MIGSDLASDCPRVSGTVVWSLCSTTASEVKYHVDYAELYRYETNIIYPPLYAGTIQVSPLGMQPCNETNTMEGGSFLVNTSGLEHYKKFGYKGNLVRCAEDGIAVTERGDDGYRSNALMADIATSSAWQEIRYMRNRGILHDGNYPHLSTPVKRLPDSSVKRCILGFNCFTEDVGNCCKRAPEHSRAFNRTIRLYQALASTKAKDDGTGACSHTRNRKDKSGFTPQEVMKNPALARLLVAAAKIKKASQSSVEQQD
jgi:hypothetical protein